MQIKEKDFSVTFATVFYFNIFSAQFIFSKEKKNYVILHIVSQENSLKEIEHITFMNFFHLNYLNQLYLVL